MLYLNIFWSISCLSQIILICCLNRLVLFWHVSDDFSAFFLAPIWKPLITLSLKNKPRSAFSQLVFWPLQKRPSLNSYDKWKLHKAQDLWHWKWLHCAAFATTAQRETRLFCLHLQFVWTFHFVRIEIYDSVFIIILLETDAKKKKKLKIQIQPLFSYNSVTYFSA